jgi:hypothetical protein
MTDKATNDNKLGGLISESDALQYTEVQWRVIQFNCMCGLQSQIKKLNDKMGWRTMLTSIPWALLGGIMTFIIMGKI